ALAVRPWPWLALAEDPHALFDKRITRGDNVADLVAHVVNAALGAACQEFCNRGRLAKWRDQLDLGVWQRDEGRGDPVLRLRQGCRHLRAERVAVKARRCREITHRDRHMVQPSNHAEVSLAARSMRSRTSHTSYGEDVDVADGLLAPRRAHGITHGAPRSF